MFVFRFATIEELSRAQRAEGPANVLANPSNCAKSMIKKRYLHLTEEILKKNPNICEYKALLLTLDKK
ncbi:hypothetical protein R3W88_030832 [Solanum pinnatisectum]|uniref:Chalcone/stilbene synthase N-terminal domain-containing protein n=1 Tax=Solanum pinnatisectum TaxID=50273 RepID=A0AAV9LNA0_9SOLN|nr:hypothetical protein R3W88_030832 [Solanum pinnatisectum]